VSPDGVSQAREVGGTDRLAVAAVERGKAVIFGGTIGFVLLVDLLSKKVIQQALYLGESVRVLGDMFRLTYIHNPGAAFGLNVGPYSRFVFLGLALIALGVLVIMYRQTAAEDRLRLLALGAIAGGALGNMIDRVRWAEGVVDFLDFGVGNLRWPVFNIADTAVTIGATLLLISLWLEDRRRAREHGSAD
jgi:signal peptidase II